jgi:hypothetical protein
MAEKKKKKKNKKKKKKKRKKKKNKKKKKKKKKINNKKKKKNKKNKKKKTKKKKKKKQKKTKKKKKRKHPSQRVHKLIGILVNFPRKPIVGKIPHFPRCKTRLTYEQQTCIRIGFDCKNNSASNLSGTADFNKRSSCDQCDQSDR